MKLQGWDLYRDDVPTWKPFRIFLGGGGLVMLSVKNMEPQVYAEFAGWWFQIFFMFNPTWGNDPF